MQKNVKMTFHLVLDIDEEVKAGSKEMRQEIEAAKKYIRDVIVSQLEGKWINAVTIMEIE